MTSPMDAKRARRVARAGGVLYLVIIVLGALGEAVVRGGIVVPGDAAATAANLRSMEWLWRLGIAGETLLLACGTALSLILFVLLRPVSRDLALLALVFNLVCIAIEGVAAVSLAAALHPLSEAGYTGAFTPAQLDVLTTLAVRSHRTGFGIALIFFGVECLILGLLIFRSGYLPKSIGVLLQIAGPCYVVNSFALLLSPPLSSRLTPAILVPPLVAEVALALWLVVKGVRPEEWDRHARAGIAETPA